MGLLQRDIRDLKYDLKSFQLEYYSAQSSYSELMTAIEVAELSLDMEIDYYQERALSALMKALRKAEDLYGNDVARITILTEKMPRQYAVIIDEVVALLREKPTG